MAETAITETSGVGKWSTTGAAVAMQAADVANGNKFTGRTHAVLVVHNTNAGAQTISITSVAIPPNNRLGNVSAQSLAAGSIRVFELTTTGWANSSGNIIINASHADVKLGVYVVQS